MYFVFTNKISDASTSSFEYWIFIFSTVTLKILAPIFKTNFDQNLRNIISIYIFNCISCINTQMPPHFSVNGILFTSFIRFVGNILSPSNKSKIWFMNVKTFLYQKLIRSLATRIYTQQKKCLILMICVQCTHAWALLYQKTRNTISYNFYRYQC